MVNKTQLKTEKKRIFVYIETEVQFDSIAPLLHHIKESTDYGLDIVVPSHYGADDEEVFNAAARKIKNSGFSVFRDGSLDKVRKRSYQILLSAYIYRWQYDNLRVKYFIQYAYGPYYFNKPAWNIQRLLSSEYLADAVLSHAVGTQAAIDVVSKSYITPELRLINFNHRPIRMDDKPTILFAPTYDNMEFAVHFVEAIDELKKNYRIVCHGHHRAIHVKHIRELLDQLYAKADKVYDLHKYTIKTPLEEADILVSDDSSVFLEAISVNVPVALFSKDPNAFRYRDINSIQYELVNRGDVLWTNDPKNLPEIISKTLTSSMISRQRKLSEELFPDNFEDPVGRYMDILNIYLEDELPSDYYYMKKYWIEKIDGLEKSVESSQAQIEKLTLDLSSKERELASFLSVKRSVKLLVGNIARRIKRLKK